MHIVSPIEKGFDSWWCRRSRREGRPFQSVCGSKGDLVASGLASTDV